MINFKFYGGRKKYDKAFKLKVVEASFARGNVKEVAEEYGLDPQMLSTWRSQYKNHKEIAFPGNGRKMQTEAEKEISRLQKSWQMYAWNAICK